MRRTAHLSFLFAGCWFFGCYGSVSLDNDWGMQPLKLLNQKPDLQWEQKFNEPIQDVFPVNDSLALVFTHRSTAFILNSLSGKIEGAKWHPNLRKFSTLKMNREGRFFAFTSRKGEWVGLYDLELGKQRWKEKEKRLIESGLEIVNDSLVAIATRHKIKFLSLLTGELSSVRHVRQGILSLQQVGDQLFIIQDNGILKAFKVDKLLWKIDLGLTHESKVLEAGKEWIMAVNGNNVTFINKRTGEKLSEIGWKPLVHVFLKPDNEKIILVSKNGSIMSYAISTGEEMEINESSSGLVKHRPTFSGSICVIPFADGTLSAINVERRTLEWQIVTKKPLTGFWRTGQGFMTQDVKKRLRYYQ